MRLSAPAAGLFLVAIIFAANSPSAQAREAQKVELVSKTLSVMTEDPINQPLAQAAEPSPPKPKEPKQHIVADGESLSKIAAANATTWQRLFNKNLDIENPDVIVIGSKVIIPLPEEVLAERPLPAAPPAPADTAAANSQKHKKRATATAYRQAPRGSSSGNTYASGYCTWYAKNRRPDLPNNLGNANTWVSRAAGQGIATGSTPRAGAIGQQGNHVVYVEAVNGDGTIRISEMNYAGLGVVSGRTASAGSFMYIY